MTMAVHLATLIDAYCMVYTPNPHSRMSGSESRGPYSEWCQGMIIRRLVVFIVSDITAFSVDMSQWTVLTAPLPLRHVASGLTVEPLSKDTPEMRTTFIFTRTCNLAP